MSGHKMLVDPPKWGNQRLNIEQSPSEQGKINYRNPLRLRSPAFEVLSLGDSPITSSWLPNPLKYSHCANMQSGHNLHGAFSDAQTLQLSFSQSQKEKDSTANATLWHKSDLLYEELQQLKRLPSLRGLVRLPDNIELVSYCPDDALVLRWRRLISPCNAVTINCAVLSPCSFNDSTLSATSCGTRASNFFDFAFTALVAISASISNRWLTVYTKNIHKKGLTWLTLKNRVVADTLKCSGNKNSNAPKCLESLSRRLTTT